jgi:hypothetical protein
MSLVSFTAGALLVSCASHAPHDEPSRAVVAKPPTRLLTARRVPTPADPLRVDVIGDSMAFALSGGLDHALRETGRAIANNRGWWGFGLTSGWPSVRNKHVVLPANPDFGVWPQRFEQLVAHDDPDVFVAYLGGWDLGPRTVGGRVLVPPSRAWQSFYGRLLDRAVAILTARGAKVYMLGPPCDGEGPDEHGYNRGTALLRQVFAELAARHPESVGYLSLNPLLCPTGRPTDYHGTGEGRIRVFDNHFTPAGARFVGSWFVDQIANTWHLRDES